MASLSEQDRYLDVATMKRPDQARLRTPKPNPHQKGKCRWCSGDVRAPRRGWCSDACVRELLALYPGSLRRAAELRDKGCCALCGAQGQKVEWEADHIVPLSEGGLNLMSNIRTLCRACHAVETRELAARRAAARRAARQAPAKAA